MLDHLRANLALWLVPKQNGRFNLPGAFRGKVENFLLSSNQVIGDRPRRGTTELLRAYSDMPWLRAIVNKVGKSVGQTSWKLYVVRNAPAGQAIRPMKLQNLDRQNRKKLLLEYKQENRLEEIEFHPLLTLLNEGNRLQTGMTVFQLTQMHMDLVGEAFWLIETNGAGMPITLWPLAPDWVRHLPTPARPTYIVQVVGQTGISTGQVEIPIENIIQFIEPDPAEPYGRGTGIARALADELETDEYAAKHLKGFFLNSARPDLIISGENIGPDDTKRLEEKWQQKFQGFLQSFRPAFFSRKIDVKEIGQSFESMQMTQLRKMERDTIIEVYGVPPEKLGIINESKRSTIAAADFFWNKDILLPRVEQLRDVMQDQLVPAFDERLVLDYESPVVQDQEFELNVMKAAPWAFSANEFRHKGAVDELDEDFFMWQNSNIPVSEEDVESGDFPEPEEPEESGEEPQEEEDLQEAAIRSKLAMNLSDPEVMEKIVANVHRKIAQRSS